MEIVVGIHWECKHPQFAVSQSQPLQGILLVVATILVGAVVGVVHYYLVGGGEGPPHPILMHCMIVSVVITFWMTIMFGGWPFSLIKNKAVSGLALVTGCYVVNYILFRILFDYGFMAGAPIYNPALDPGGMFNGGTMVVAYLAFIAIMFLFLHFDLWPMTTQPGIMAQPVLGIVWTAICGVLGAGLFFVGIGPFAMDPQIFNVVVPIPFIFGTIIVLNMLHNSTFIKFGQPVRGVLNVVAAAVIGTALAALYNALSGSVTGDLGSGPPGYEYEIWIASALLGVTFPFLIFFAEFFKMWPLKKPE
jgi:hypothetical protein